MTFWNRRWTTVSTALAVTLLAACGATTESGESAAAETPPADAPAATEGAPAAEEAATADRIALPDGWKMQEAITAEEVGAITGEGMEYFAEASSAAQKGQPAAGFTVPGKGYSKIGFHVWVDGGEEKFENPRGFATEGTVEEVPDVGDEAYVCDFENGMTAFMVRKGETVIRIDWFPETWDSFEKVELGRQLAGKLLENMYG